MRLNQSESSSLNPTNTSLGSPIIGTLIGKAIGDSVNSDDDAEREEKKLNEFAILPNKSVSDPTLARKAIDTTFVLTNHYDGQQQTVTGIEEMRKELLNSLVSAILK